MLARRSRMAKSTAPVSILQIEQLEDWTLPAPLFSVVSLGENYYPASLNDNGVVVGTLYSQILGQSEELGFVWQDGNTYKYHGFSPVAINNNNQIVGNTGWEAAYLSHFTGDYELLAQDDFDDDGSGASAINDAGQIVGFTSGRILDHGMFPVIWESPNSKIVEINVPPYNQGSAIDINNKGQIVGFGRDGFGGFLSFEGKATKISKDAGPSAINDLG